MNNDIISFIKYVFKNTEAFIPLHEPRFLGNEKKYLLDTIDSTFVSSVGMYVNKVEEMVCDFTKAKFAIATSNGTSALHIGLILAGVNREDEVLTQALTFVATANAISYIGAQPVFLDVDRDTLGLSPSAVKKFLTQQCEVRAGKCYNKATGKKISACVPMHTFGIPCRMDELKQVCDQFSIPIVEDAAESLGSYYKGQHTGLMGLVGVISFNGNKVITSGGGGIIMTNDETLAKKAKHLTTTAKVPHSWEFYHDEIAYNYRMPNLNAALACAQLEQLPYFLECKKHLSEQYKNFFSQIADVTYIDSPSYGNSNCWLNAILFDSIAKRDDFLKESNNQKVMTRPIWVLINKLPMYKNCQHDELENSIFLEERVVNIPSSVILKEKHG